MNARRFIQIHTLHSYPAALLNRDDAGLAKRMPFGGVERTRVSSQCLKRHWRMANDPFALCMISPDIGVSVRSRRVWSVKVADALVAEGVDQKAVEAVLKAMQDDLYGQSKKAQATTKDTEIDLDRSELVVLGFKEIEYLKHETKRIVAHTGADPKKIAVELKDLRKNFHALVAGAGIDAAMFGRFVSGDRDARVDAAVHVAHAFTVHAQASEPDYFTAVDDLQAEEQGSGAGHLNTAELTSGVYYGYVVVDVPSLVANLEGCAAKRWLEADRTLAAKAVENSVHLIAKVTPGAKLGSTAPYDWASLVLIEAGDEQPRTLANAFMEPIRRAPQDKLAADALAQHVASIDGMYGSTAKRWIATRLAGVEVAGATACTFPKLVTATAAAIKGGMPEVRCLILRLDGPLMAFGDVAVDEIRPTRRLPTLSMMVGLLGNALGYDHGDVHALQRLQDRLLIAARLDHAGRTIVDYQTAEIGKKDLMWTTRGAPAERAGGDQSYTGPVLRYRHYVADAVVTLALSLEPADEAPTLDDLAAALRRPARPLFLGRKGCPPARPLLAGRLQEVVALADALAAVPVEPRRGERADASKMIVEVPDRAGEPMADRVVEVADVRDWVAGLHAGGRRVRELRIARGGEP